MDGNQGVSAVVFDWAGTMVDFGSHAPMGAFQRLFATRGVEISIAEARVPMGLPKWDHINALGQLPRVAAAWKATHYRPFESSDVDELYRVFTEMTMEAVGQHADLIPGVLETIAKLRAQGIKIGSTTGYNRPIMNVLQPLAFDQGLVVDTLVCADDLTQNRPSPLGMYKTFIDLGVWPTQRVVKVDDTVPGLMEGRNAGAWTVAIIASGNEVGLTPSEWHALSANEKEQHRVRVRENFQRCSPDYFIDTVAELLPIIEEINARISAGEDPNA